MEEKKIEWELKPENMVIRKVRWPAEGMEWAELLQIVARGGGFSVITVILEHREKCEEYLFGVWGVWCVFSSLMFRRRLRQKIIPASSLWIQCNQLF